MISITVNEGGVTDVGVITVNFAGIQQGPGLNGRRLIDIADVAAHAADWLGAGDADLDGS